MRREKILENQMSFIADTKSIEVHAQNIDSILFGLQFLEAGVTPPTLATIIPSLNDIKLTVGGEVVSLVRSDDLFILNKIWGITPMELIPTADNEFGHLMNLHLPVELTTDKTVLVSAKDNTPATIDTELLTVSVRYRNKPYNGKPLCLQYISGNTATSFKEASMALAGKSLLEMLIFNTTIPVVGTSHEMTVAELKLLVKRSEVSHIHYASMECVPYNAEETTGLGVADNYRYVNFRDDPIPASNLKVALKSYSAATDAFRILGVYR